MKFEEIIGNESKKEILKKIIMSNQIGHSYLFLGIEGIGKKIIAKEFSKKILCLDEKKQCLLCKSCSEFEGESHPDFTIINSEGNNIKIDQIREFQKKVYEKPVISTKKVYIINDADLMTKEAQNCLLKTLEEPPNYVVIILVASNEDKLLNTIKSRCTKMVFSKLTIDELKRYIYDENIEEDILKYANGSIKKLIHICEHKETYIEVGKIIKNLSCKNLLDVLKNTELFTKDKDIINEILDYMCFMFYDMVHINKNDVEKYGNCIYVIDEVKRRISQNSNYDMCIDFLLLRIWEEINEKCSRS